MKRFLLFIALFILGLSSVYATHNRAGEITYTWISGYTYKVRVTTYTNTCATTADRCQLTVLTGDGDSVIVPRINGLAVLDCAHAGEMVSGHPCTQLNIYEGIYTWHGPGNYILTMEDPNRNAGVCNIPNSVETSFFLRTELIINPWMPANSSPLLLNPPIDDACQGQCYEHNPGAYDADGDSLYYKLSTCYASGVPIPGWTYPPNMNSESINHNNGDFIWCAPPDICVYNVAIVIEEWKLFLPTHTRYYVGFVLRDMQITVGNCTDNAPLLPAVPDTCVVAGTNLHFNVFASDPDGNDLTLNATGGPFELTPAATFPEVSGFGSVTSTFNWTPNCSEIQLLPYLVTFKVTDNVTPTALVNFESAFIKVIAPAPTGISATPSGSSMVVNWTAPFCNSTTGANPLIGYYIYRKDTCDPWTPSPCETGVPAYTGYTLVGSTLAGVTTFTDNNGGLGLLHGVDYSYIVVAHYADGSESYASTNVCAQLVRDVPIITNVSVMTTDPSIGKIWTHWVKPLGTATNLDTIANPPPYEYRLMQATGYTGSLTFTAVPGASYTYPAYWELTDTGFVNTGLNTTGAPYTYRVDFYSNGLLKGSTHTASSVFLSTVPAGNQITLNWNEYIPWDNYIDTVYREVPTGSGTWNVIGTSTTKTFTDLGLINGQLYCYKVKTQGQYSDPALPRPLYNFSQEKCDRPVDIIPPCQPPLTIATDCGINENVLSWTNPNTFCCNDAVQYNVYFSPTTTGEMVLIYSTTDMSATTFTHADADTYPGIISIAGCYAVTAVDSALVPNESPIINKVCVDNCPEYELPNVFTPNNDGDNDYFTPLPGYRYVKDIDIKIYDRWGVLMFQTTNKDILWDGRNKDSKKQCSDGTYFYICLVNEITVDGIKQFPLKGFVQLINKNH